MGWLISMGLALSRLRRALSNLNSLDSGVVGSVHITPKINSNAAPAEAHTRTSTLRMRASKDVAAIAYFFSDFSIFAQVSRNVTVRLKTRASGLESRSTQKYPSRSN